MSARLESVIRQAYGEAVLAAKEKGLSGPAAVHACYRAAAKVASRITSESVTAQDVERVIRGTVPA
jgi:hypothetical protein